ncbi:hypothetical protein PHISP_08061 [Aspergillus sp. HF37]|nr:hypothetical protein PHISP_08061 [Aspergillus sp. HF37]
MPFFRKNKPSLPSANSAEQLSPVQADDPQRRFSAYDDHYCHPAHARVDTLSSASSAAPYSDSDKSRGSIFARSSKNSPGPLERSLSVRGGSGENSNSPGARHEIEPSMPRTPQSIHRTNTEPSLGNAALNLPQSGQRPPSQQSLPPSPFPYLDVMERGRDSISKEPPGEAQPKDPREVPKEAKETSRELSKETSRETSKELSKDRSKEAQSKDPSQESKEATSTGPPERKQEDEDVQALTQKHDELTAKYSKVKRYYFEKEAQVQHLQNTVAHQRMAVSRTVLDDNEYGNRFTRLDGAIKDLAFSIRKDWKTVPTWLQGCVNEDALATGKREMTAIGRAAVSRWVVDEVFARHFHPGLEPTLSMQLKGIELSLRQQQVRAATEEDKENAIAKISNWRRATFDGLGDTLQDKMAEDNRAQLTDHLIAKLVASLEMNLADPPPADLEGNARTIVENTIGIAEKIPLESRDVCVDYFLPGTPLNETLMKPETGLPPPTNVKAEPEERDEEGSEGSEEGSTREKTRSVFKTLMKRASGRGGEKKEEVQRIRFASFMSAEVRGKGPTNVLVKAPVYM